MVRPSSIPDSEYARRAIRCQVELQARAGGNALIGRMLYPLLREAGFGRVHVSPRMVYVDSSKPDLVEGFTRKTFTAMIEGIRKFSLESGIMSEADFDKGIADLYRTAEADGIFCYTFLRRVLLTISMPNKVLQGVRCKRRASELARVGWVEPYLIHINARPCYRSIVNITEFVLIA